MNNLKIYIIIFFYIALEFNLFAQQNNFPILKGPYLGQIPPDTIPTIFAPEIISIKERHEFACSFSPDGNELFFTIDASNNNSDNLSQMKIMYTKQINNQWTVVKEIKFSDNKHEMECFFSTNGNRLYFCGFDNFLEGQKIWYVERESQGWSEAKLLKLPSTNPILYATLADNNNVYYTDIKELKIFCSKYKNNKYLEEEELGLPLGAIHPYISPDESFILFDANFPEGYGQRDIYVTFKKSDGTWTKAYNLGKNINSKYYETRPTLSPDGKYIFYSHYPEPDEIADIYWVSAEILSKFK